MNIFPSWYYRYSEKENAAAKSTVNCLNHKEKPVTVGLSPEAIATLLLIFLNKKEGKSGGMTIKWGFRSYEFKDLGELTQKGLISNPVGGRDSKSLWLTPAGNALGSVIRDILLPELEKLAGSLEPKEVKDAK